MRKNFVHYLPYCGVMTAATFIFTMINITIPLRKQMAGTFRRSNGRGNRV